MRIQSISNNVSSAKQKGEFKAENQPAFGVNIGADKLEKVIDSKNIKPQIRAISDVLYAKFKDVSGDVELLPNGAIGSFAKGLGNRFSQVVEKFQLNSEMSDSKYVTRLQKSVFLVADKMASVERTNAFVRELAEKYGVDIDFAQVNNESEYVQRSASEIMEASICAAEKLNKFKRLQEPLSALIRVDLKKDEKSVYLDLFSKDSKDKASQYSILIPQSNNPVLFNQFDKSIDDAFVYLRNARNMANI